MLRKMLPAILSNTWVGGLLRSALALLIATTVDAHADSSQTYRLTNNTTAHTVTVAGASATFKTYQPHEYVESCEALAATPTLKRNVDLGIKLDILNLAYPAQSDVVTVTFAQTTLIEIRSVQIFDCRIDLPQIETTLAMATFSMQPGAKHKLIERGNDVWYLERLN